MFIRDQNVRGGAWGAEPKKLTVLLGSDKPKQPAFVVTMRSCSARRVAHFNRMIYALAVTAIIQSHSLTHNLIRIASAKFRLGVGSQGLVIGITRSFAGGVRHDCRGEG